MKSANPKLNPTEPTIYQIRVKGHLDDRWSDWFDGLTILSLGETDTLLTGIMIDQAALHGVLAVIRNLKLTLLSLHRMENSQTVIATHNVGQSWSPR